MSADPTGIVFYFDAGDLLTLAVRVGAWNGVLPGHDDILDLDNLTPHEDDTVYAPGQLAELAAVARVSRRWRVYERTFGVHNTIVLHLCIARGAQ